jgi:hypothetical protein
MLVKAGSKDNTKFGPSRLAMNDDLGYDTVVTEVVILEAENG